MIKLNDDTKCTPKQKAAEIIEDELNSGIEGWLEDNIDGLTVKQLDAIEDHLSKYSKRINKLLGREQIEE